MTELYTDPSPGGIAPVYLDSLLGGPGKAVQFGEQPIGYSSEIPHAFQGYEVAITATFSPCFLAPKGIRSLRYGVHPANVG